MRLRIPSFSFRRLFYSPFGALCLLVLCISIGMSVLELRQKALLAAHAREEAFAREQVLAQSKQRIETDVADLDTSRGVERVLRDSYNIARAGEEVVFLVSDEKATSTNDRRASTQSWWERLLSLFW